MGRMFFEIAVVLFIIASALAHALMFSDIKEIKDEIIRTRTQIKNELNSLKKSK